MEFYGNTNEIDDDKFTDAFEVDKNLSVPQADEKWIESVEYHESVIKRRSERFESVMVALNSVERFYKDFPTSFIDISIRVLQITNSDKTQTDIINQVREQSIKILEDTKTLYRQCNIKNHVLTRRKFAYALWNRPESRSDFPVKSRFNKNMVTEYLSSITMSLNTYQGTIEYYNNKIKSIENKRGLGELIDVYKNMIKYYEEEIELINDEIKYYYALRAMM